MIREISSEKVSFLRYEVFSFYESELSLVGALLFDESKLSVTELVSFDESEPSVIGVLLLEGSEFFVKECSYLRKVNLLWLPRFD